MTNLTLIFLSIVLGFGLGLKFGGTLILQVLRIFQWSRRDKMVFFVTRLGLLVIALFLLYHSGNWYKIIYPEKIPKNFSELPTILLTRVNVQLFGLGVFITLLLALAYLCNLLFVSFDTLNIFGLGYQKKVENQAKIAEEALKAYRTIENIRMIILKVLGSEEIYQEIIPLVNNGGFNAYEASSVVARVIEDSFKQLGGINISAGVVSVYNGNISPSDMKYLPKEVQYVVKRCYDSNKVTNELGQILATTLLAQENDPSYCILYLKNGSSDVVFDKADQLMVENAWAMILRHRDIILEQSA